MCYLWLQTKQSLFPIALVTNASVHVIMYGYYLLCVMGLRPKWKRLVTDCQIVQFVFGFVVSVLMLYYHFTGFGCLGFGVGASTLCLMRPFWHFLLIFIPRAMLRRRSRDDQSVVIVLCFLFIYLILVNYEWW
ncbi:hypothetical protein KPL70_014114 [Citrus sinensis]|nr:hypothetical protein KPL70_014114 [Citrus sinensis]